MRTWNEEFDRRKLKGTTTMLGIHDDLTTAFRWIANSFGGDTQAYRSSAWPAALEPVLSQKWDTSVLRKFLASWFRVLLASEAVAWKGDRYQNFSNSR